jgi:hypothetical protein
MIPGNDDDFGAFQAATPLVAQHWFEELHAKVPLP